MRRPACPDRPRPSGGFTLLEVLVSTVVLSLGLLGLAGLQLTTLRASEGTYWRSQATLRAHDLVDRMRANPAGVEAGFYDRLEPPKGAPDCRRQLCGPAQIAALDAYEWFDATTALLPGGGGSVERLEEGTWRVTVQWNDVRDSEENDDDFSLVVRL